MFKLDLEMAEERDVKLPTSVGSLRKQEFQKNIYFCFIDYTKAFECVDHNKLWKILKEMSPEKPVWRSRSDRTRNNRLVPSWERSTSRLYIVTVLI